MNDYTGIWVMGILALGVSFIFILGAQLLGPRKPNPAKAMPYECGEKPFESPSGKHAVKFYMAAILFVIFDIEIIFLFPWAVTFRQTGASAFWGMMLFLGVFELGFLYAWRKGALEWK